MQAAVDGAPLTALSNALYTAILHGTVLEKAHVFRLFNAIGAANLMRLAEAFNCGEGSDVDRSFPVNSADHCKRTIGDYKSDLFEQLWSRNVFGTNCVDLYEAVETMRGSSDASTKVELLKALTERDVTIETLARAQKSQAAVLIEFGEQIGKLEAGLHELRLAQHPVHVPVSVVPCVAPAASAVATAVQIRDSEGGIDEVWKPTPTDVQGVAAGIHGRIEMAFSFLESFANLNGATQRWRDTFTGNMNSGEKSRNAVAVLQHMCVGVGQLTHSLRKSGLISTLKFVRYENGETVEQRQARLVKQARQH